MYRRLLFSLCLGLCLIAALPALAAQNWTIPGAKSHYASLEGHQVHYQTLGRGFPALVLVHGWSCNTSIWHKQAPALAAKYRVILVDLLGHGKSDKPHLDYTQTLFANCIKEVLDKEGIKRAVLIGHSMGTPVCLQTARLYPGLVQGLVIVDGAFIFPPKEPKARAEYKKLLAGWLAPMQRKIDYKKKVEEFIRPMLGPKLPPETAGMIMTMTTATPQHVGSSATAGMFNMDNLDFWYFGPLSCRFWRYTRSSPRSIRNLNKIWPR
jgi:pimeloyl-ACP methyl ester carboxylesterase